jgi:hypothetical protein
MKLGVPPSDTPTMMTPSSSAVVRPSILELMSLRFYRTVPGEYIASLDDRVEGDLHRGSGREHERGQLPSPSDVNQHH